MALGTLGQRTVAHRVSASGTLWRLAIAYYGGGTKLSVIRLFKGLRDTDVIQNGQVLVPEPALSGEIPEEPRPVGWMPLAAH